MRKSRMVAWAMFAVAIPVTIAAFVLLALGWSTEVPVGWGVRGFSGLVGLASTGVGFLIVLNRPANAVGWVFLTLGLISGIQAAGIEYAHYSFLARDNPLPGALVIAWVVNWIWILLIGLLAIGLFMLFPDGRFHSTLWRNVGIVSISFCAFMGVALALAPGPLESAAPYLNSPYSLSIFDNATVRLFPLLAFVLAAAGASQIHRYRNSGSEVRQQMKWLAAMSLLVAATLMMNIVQQKIIEVATVFALMGIPVAAAIAILRHRLYDIDVIINRALVYGGLTATLAGVYFATVVALQFAFRSVTGQESNLALVVSTLAIAFLFQPVRRRVQGVIDRRLYRNQYDAAQTLNSFSKTARDEVDLERLTGALVGVVNHTVRPTHTSLWLRQESNKIVRGSQVAKKP